MQEKFGYSSEGRIFRNCGKVFVCNFMLDSAERFVFFGFFETQVVLSRNFNPGRLCFTLRYNRRKIIFSFSHFNH